GRPLAIPDLQRAPGEAAGAGRGRHAPDAGLMPAGGVDAMRWLTGLALIAAVAQVGGGTAGRAAVPSALRVAFVAPAAVQPPAADPAVIFADDFNQAEDLHARYFEYGDADGSFVRAPDEERGGGL